MNWKALVSFPYQLVHQLRKLLYSLGILKAKKLDAFVISVGNLSFGGTGKTPITIKIAKHLQQQGLRVAVLTRGYKGGDEAMEMRQSFEGTDIQVLENPNRYQAGVEIQDQVDVFILDDGQQHLQLDRDINIIIKNIYESGFYREFPWNERQADYLIHSKVDDYWIKENSGKYFAKFNLALTQSLHDGNDLGVMTGIGDPKSFLSMLRNHLKAQGHWDGKSPIKTKLFPDHHWFTVGEIAEMKQLSKNIICTAKDIVKIPEEMRDGFVVAELELDCSAEFLSSLVQNVKGGN